MLVSFINKFLLDKFLFILNTSHDHLGKVCIPDKWSIRAELIVVSVVQRD